MTLKVGYEMLHYNNEMYLAMNTSNLLMKQVEIILLLGFFPLLRVVLISTGIAYRHEDDREASCWE